MATTACTNNYYSTVVVGVANNITGGTSIVTFNTSKPIWTGTDTSSPSQNALQCSAISIGGFNGLNS